MTQAWGLSSLCWRFSIPAIALAALSVSLFNHAAEAVIQPIYTLPFYDGSSISCGFGCYEGHVGVDYEVGIAGAGGERIAAAAAGTAKPCALSATAGNYIVLDHGNGHRTRSLHLNSEPLPANGAQVARGQVIGYEGNTGQTDPPGFYHLHFETRHGATTFTCNYDGTAVDPYAASTYMWTTNPPTGCQGIAWSAWENAGGTFPSTPAAATWSCHRLDVFIRGWDNAILHIVWDGFAWSPWENLGGTFPSSPTVTSSGWGRLDVFARGWDNALWRKALNNGVWSAWENLGGTFPSDPAATSPAPNQLQVFIRGWDNSVLRTFWNGTAWSAWENLGGTFPSDPAATSWGSGRLDVFFRGWDNALWRKYWTGSAWSAWESVGGVFPSDPAATSWGPNRLDVFVRGSNNAVLRIFWNGAVWSAWENLGGIFQSDPAATSWGLNRLDVFFRGTDNALWHKWY